MKAIRRVMGDLAFEGAASGRSSTPLFPCQSYSGWPPVSTAEL
jgi:hypothetical protein